MMQKNERKQYKKWTLSRGQILVIIVVTIFCLLSQLIFLRATKRNRYLAQIGYARVYGEGLASSILLNLEHSINLTETLKALYLEYDENFMQNFDRYCECLADGKLFVGSLYIAPDGIIRAAYPKSVEKATMGFNMLESPEQKASAILAKESKKITIAGPHKLVEGGTGFIIRNPIYDNDGNFKAFTIIVMKWDEFVKHIIDNARKEGSGYYFGVWKDNDEKAITDINGFIFSDSSKPLTKIIDIPVDVANDVWHLTVEPENGWLTYKSLLKEFLISGLFVFLIVGFTIYRQIGAALRMYSYEHDALTGLLTRSAFHRRVRKLFKENPEVSYDVLIADIENFKVVNSIYGTKKCDDLLCYLADCFSHAANNLYCSRYGGDQFIVIFNSTDNMGAEFLAKQNQMFLENAPIKNIVIKYGFYGNIDKSVPVNLISDRALMAVKSILHSYDVILANYEGDVSKRHMREQILESSFEKSLLRGDFKVWYQPKFDAQTEKLVGAEALVRWISEDGTVVSPADFIYVFEDDGLITRLDEYVFRTVCSNIKYWIDKGMSVVPISINLSRTSLHHKGVVQKYSQIVKDIGVPIEYVPLELTESTAYSSSQMKDLAKELKAEGFRLDMDDFGTGSSSLASMNILPFDVIKVDKSLIDFIGDPGGNELVRHTIELAHFKKMVVVAEGVETKEQLEFLRQLNCDIIQGYYFSAPLSYDDSVKFFTRLYKEGRV